ncbi:citrate synthase-like protein [Paraphysoderma sedebokerense]|nr:citrate synthase-like protein [Paraphysoderma sedebokerense]
MGQKNDKQTPTTHSANLILKDPNSNQSWTIPAPVPASSSSSTDNVKPSTFVVVPHASQPDTLTVLDNRTSKIYQIPIEDGTIKATEFQKIVARDEGIRVFDPSYLNTAVARSKITEIDGEKGILRYRGYPIEELAEKSTFLEVAYLLIYGELPTKSEFAHFEHEVLHHTFVHSKFTELMKSFNYDSHPMGMFISAIAAMSTFHPEANPSLQGSYIYQKSSRLRNKQIFRLLGKSITVAAMAYRHRIGRQYNDPPNGMGYTEMFLYMMDRLSENEYKPNPKLARALDILFILHADHELNCSTAAMRHIGSSLVDPYSAVAGAAAALYGPLHGGANEAVVRMLESIKHPSNVPQFIEDVKNKKAMLMGFGHRVYKNYDPRAKIIRKVAYEVFEIVGREPLIEVAVELEKAALNDQYFIERKLYPNVDFYSGLIYKAMGFPLDFFPVLFAIPRIAGWLAHWVEHLSEDKLQIWRPRQIYTGEGKRSYLPMEYREENRKEKQDGGKKGELPTVIDKV